MKKNKLYIINNSNKHFFDWGGLAIADRQANPWNYANDLDITQQYKQSTNAFGISKIDNPFSKGNIQGGLGAMVKTPIGGSLVGALGSTVGKIGGNLIGGGLQSGAGNAISNIGGTIGSALSTVNPVLGGIVSVGSGLIGGLTNRLFGMKVDQAKLNAANQGTAAYNNFQSDASTLDDIFGPTAQENVQNAYTGGLFSSGKARRKNAELRRQRIEARQLAFRSIDNNLYNLTDDQMNNALANYTAYGGSLNKKYAVGGLMDAFKEDPVSFAYNYVQTLNDIDGQRASAAQEREKDNKILDLQNQIYSLENQRAELQNGLNPYIISVPENSVMLDDVNNFTDSSVGSTKKYPNKKATKNKNWNYIKDALKRSGKFNDVQIEGIRQNLERESNFNPSLVGDGGAAFGLGQWHGNRQPKDTSLKGQTQHLINTLSNFDGNNHWIGRSNYDGFMHARTPEEAHYYIAKGYERPASSILNRVKRNADMSLRNINAFGGELGTNGTDWTNGLLEINEGGSHESNPLEGVPMGIDEEGVPNLVEEGETVWNDYVFSNRLKVPKELHKDLGLSGAGKKGISFADASKKIAEESKQRPNDPISNAGLEEGLNKLVEIQEAERMKEQMKEYAGLKEYAFGGRLYEKGSRLKKYKYYSNGNDNISIPTGFKVDKTGRAYDYTKEYRDLVNKLTANNVRDWAKEHPNDLSLQSFIANGNSLEDLTDDEVRTGATDGIYGFLHHVAEQRFSDDEFRRTNPYIAKPIDAESDNIWQNLYKEAPRTFTPSKAPESKASNNSPKPYWTGLRYTPALGAGIMALTDTLGLTNKPDYTYANKLEAVANQAAYAPHISFDPIGDYLAYRPMDIWYEQNRMNANTRATDRSLINTGGGNRGAIAAGLLANGYNSQIANGNLYRQALEYNDAKRERVADFNRRTNMYNSQMGLEAARANAELNQQARQMNLSGLAQAAALRDNIDQRIGAARAANLTNLFNSLGEIGRENMAFNMINSANAAHNGYWIDNQGTVHYTNKQKRNGGKIKKH